MDDCGWQSDSERGPDCKVVRETATAPSPRGTAPSDDC